MTSGLIVYIISIIILSGFFNALFINVQKDDMSTVSIVLSLFGVFSLVLLFIFSAIEIDKDYKFKYFWKLPFTKIKE